MRLTSNGTSKRSLKGGDIVERKFVLVTGRTLEQGAGMHRGKFSEEYGAAVSKGEVHPEDLAALSLEEGGEVALRTEWGTANVRLYPADVPAGMLFLPMGRVANALVGGETEGTGMPSFKGIPVEISKIGTSALPRSGGESPGHSPDRPGVPAESGAGGAKERIENVVCTFCGCLCDDIAVERENDRIAQVFKACSNGRAHFLEYEAEPLPPRIRGVEASLDEALKEAGRILRASRSPLVYGLSSASTEAIRSAIRLSDLLGAFVDSTSSVCHGPTGLAMQSVGEATCTLGEVRARADLLLFWGCNPAASHPRHFSRYSTVSKGRFVPEGRKGRTVVFVDVRSTPGARTADIFLRVNPGSDYEVLTTLRALVRGRPVRESGPDPSVGGVPLTALRDLAKKLRSCRYGAAFMGMGLTMTRGRDMNVAELFRLVSELNEFTRFAVIPMRGHGNVTGADQVLTWQSGFPFAVSFARGYPRYGPGEFTAVDVLRRGDADAALIIASDPAAHFPRKAAERLEEIPVVVLDPEESLTARNAAVWIPVGKAGIDAPGSAYRMDGVPLRLRPCLDSGRPSDLEILERLIEEVTS